VSPQDITALVGALIALIGSILIPLALARHTARKEALKQAAEDKASEHSTDVISWQAINLAISRERDSLRDRLTESEAKYYNQVEQAKMKNDDELTKMKAKYDSLLAKQAEKYDGLLAKANSQIQDLQKQIMSLSALLARTEAGGKTSGGPRAEP